MRVRLLRSLSYAGDSKEKEYKYFFSLESGVSNFINKLSRTGNQKNKERKRSYFFDLVRVIPLRGLSRTGDHKNKEYKYSFLLWSGASGGRKSPSASPQIKQKIIIINLRNSASNLASQVFSDGRP